MKYIDFNSINSTHQVVFTIYKHNTASNTTLCTYLIPFCLFIAGVNQLFLYEAVQSEWEREEKLKQRKREKIGTAHERASEWGWDVNCLAIKISEITSIKHKLRPYLKAKTSYRELIKSLIKFLFPITNFFDVECKKNNIDFKEGSSCGLAGEEWVVVIKWSKKLNCQKFFG